jgi:nucleotide-binding universal stress UspA family protein
MYSHILIPVAFDGDHPTKPAEQVAHALSAPGARVTFLHVMEELPAYAINYIPEGYDKETRDAVQAQLDGKAGNFAKGEAQVIHGHSGRTIVDWAGDNGVDLIIIDSHRPGLADYFLGSTAARVVRHAQCAVHVLR